ncbi:MAG: efflux RND transporter periplasmic adaptor subunit [Gammaproteobacteria bacterium]
MKSFKGLALCAVTGLLIRGSAATEAGTEPEHEKRASGVQEQQRTCEESQEQRHFLKLDRKQIEQVGLRIAVAGPGRLTTNLTLPGKIAINADRLAHVVPRVAGLVREVKKTLGDTVTAQDVLAVIDSHDLAERKAAYLDASR